MRPQRRSPQFSPHVPSLCVRLQVVAQANNAKGEYMTKVKPKASLCDGTFHKIAGKKHFNTLWRSFHTCPYIGMNSCQFNASCSHPEEKRCAAECRHCGQLQGWTTAVHVQFSQRFTVCGRHSWWVTSSGGGEGAADASSWVVTKPLVLITLFSYQGPTTITLAASCLFRLRSH